LNQQGTYLIFLSLSRVVILYTRVYAFSDKNNKLLAFLVALFVVSTKYSFSLFSVALTMLSLRDSSAPRMSFSVSSYDPLNVSGQPALCTLD
jgi:hypothetical protein